jgi:hypothetical protein
MYKYEIEIANVEVKLNRYLKANVFDLNTEAGRHLMERVFLSNLSINGRQGFKLHYHITENGLERKDSGSWEPKAPRMDNPYLNTDEHISGLYFIGCVGFNPVREIYQYCVKIGKSSDIGNRMRQHSSSNPLLFHNHASLPLSKNQLNKAERNCHKYLDDLAIGMPSGTDEWWFVDKEVYMELCSQFSEIENFRAIAEGIE